MTVLKRGTDRSLTSLCENSKTPVILPLLTRGVPCRPLRISASGTLSVSEGSSMRVFTQTLTRAAQNRRSLVYSRLPSRARQAVGYGPG